MKRKEVWNICEISVINSFNFPENCLTVEKFSYKGVRRGKTEEEGGRKKEKGLTTQLILHVIYQQERK